MIVAVTGHREITHSRQVRDLLRQCLKTLDVTLLYQGMCSGADTLSAYAAYDMSVPYVAVRPWASHTNGDNYQAILDNAQSVVLTNDSLSYPGPSCYHVRNHYMVDHADVVLAVWDGREKGGTFATVKYAQNKNKPVFHLNPISLSIEGYL